MPGPKKGKTSKSRKTKGSSTGERPRCGLCGNTQNLTRTHCCGNWICDDEDEYVMFSYARNSCFRNHRRYTICGIHYAEEHSGDWKDCKECRNEFETEIYVYFATNEYNFEKLPDPPEYEPTLCGKCQRVIRLGYESYALKPDGSYLCEDCMQHLL